MDIPSVDAESPYTNTNHCQDMFTVFWKENICQQIVNKKHDSLWHRFYWNKTRLCSYTNLGIEYNVGFVSKVRKVRNDSSKVRKSLKQICLYAAEVALNI